MTLAMFPDPSRSAVISECGRYRYRLDRRWDKRLPTVCWIMLNPSTADASTDDATLRKISAYSRRWQFGGLVVVNLFAWRSTQPKALRLADEPTGGLTADMHIEAALAECSEVVLGWGDSGPRHLLAARMAKVLALIEASGRKPLALTTTRSGNPAHPLYLRADFRPTRWPDES